jgi:hypothetical protein
MAGAGVADGSGASFLIGVWGTTMPEDIAPEAGTKSGSGSAGLAPAVA